MRFEHDTLIDLTQPLVADVPTWDGSCGFCLEINCEDDPLFRIQHLQMNAGIGTHIDAPSHLNKDGISIEHILLNQLMIQACVIDVSHQASADYAISVEDIEIYEKRYGLIPKNSLVIGYTGWSRFWPNSTLYRNLDSKGQMHFPTFSAQAAEQLLKREIAGIAIDTLSPDCLDATFPVHRAILGAGKYIIENIGDCSQMPPRGGFVVALPLKITGGTEAPMRIVGYIPTVNHS